MAMLGLVVVVVMADEAVVVRNDVGVAVVETAIAVVSADAGAYAVAVAEAGESVGVGVGADESAELVPTLVIETVYVLQVLVSTNTARVVTTVHD